MYTKNLYNFELLSFKDFLNEVNYGSMTSDKRIDEVTDEIYQNMLENVEKYKLFGKIDVALPNKGKNPIMKYYWIEWEFKVFKVDIVNSFISDIFIQKKPGTANVMQIVINVQFDKNISNEEFRNKLLEQIVDKKMNDTLKHEVKHFVDFVDGKFKDDKYYTPTNEKTRVKYVSQNREIEAWLVSVLSDLERIKYEKSTLWKSISLQDALIESKVYRNFMKYILPSKRSKYKTKIVHFWFEKFEKDKLKGGD